MEITEVRVYPVDDNEKLKAFVTVTFEDVFVVRDLKIINGNNGLFVAMPSKKCRDGSFKDTAHPLTNDFRKTLEDKVLSEYDEQLNQVSPQPAI